MHSLVVSLISTIQGEDGNPGSPGDPGEPGAIGPQVRHLILYLLRHQNINFVHVRTVCELVIS